MLSIFATTCALLALPVATQAQTEEAPPGGEDPPPSAGENEDGAAGLTVTEIVMSKNVDGGQPVDPGTSFARSDSRIYATVRVDNPSREATTIRVAFERVGAPSAAGLELEIPGRPRYRTLARTGTQRPAGRYRCVVYSADGAELSAVEFDITE
jgi:hypothetical protein